jgi:hypothetical protein
MLDWRHAVHYRNRAEMLRTIADETPREDHKRSLRRIAEYYEKLAAASEREAAKKASPTSP